MTEKRFEFREINEPPILPKVYDVEKQKYANLFECVCWLNELYERDRDGEECYRKLLEKYDKLKEENERLRKCINTIYTIARLEEVD